MEFWLSFFEQFVTKKARSYAVLGESNKKVTKKFVKRVYFLASMLYN